MHKPIVALLITGICMFTNLFAENPLETDPIKFRTQLNGAFLSIKGEKTEVEKVVDVTITKEDRTTPLRIYIPNADKELPVIVFIHGGAWVAGNLETHDNLARYLCGHVKACVVSVGYLNAPEAKFPTSLEQCNDALVWSVDHAKEYQANARRLAVVGDSAGGNMAAALCLLNRDRNGPKIDLQVLINPVIDNTGNGTLDFKDDDLDRERWIATQYVRDSKDVTNPYVSPNFAKDLSNLPPAVIILGEKDMFRIKAKEYADRLIASGVPTNVYTQWKVGHLAGNGARASLMAQESLDVAVAALRGEFYRKSR